MKGSRLAASTAVGQQHALGSCGCILCPVLSLTPLFLICLQLCSKSSGQPPLASHSKVETAAAACRSEQQDSTLIGTGLTRIQQDGTWCVEGQF